MKKILFPTDFSEAAKQAFIYALDIADKINATIVTLHVYKLPEIKGVSLPHTLQDIYNSIDLEAFDNSKSNIPYLHKIAEEQNKTHIVMRNVIEEGETIPTILETADKIQADMIILGTKGASGLKEIFLGSVAGEILENANCLVLAIPTDAQFDGAIDKIAITMNFSDEEKKALDRVIKFAKDFKADIFCVNVDTSHTQELTHRMEKLREEYADQEHLHFEVIKGNYIYEPLAEYFQDNQIDIVAMLTHKRNFFQELFSLSHAKKMSYHCKTPVLSIQAHTLE